MVHMVTVTILTKVVIALCILGYNCHWCYGLVTNVVPGHGVQNPNYMSTYSTDNYEFCLYLCMATWECEMAVVTQQDGLKSCHLSADLVPPSQLKPNDEEVAIYQETEGTLIGDTFYFLSTPASKPGAVHDCNYRFDANVLSVANPKETREALDYVLYSGATDIWLSLIQRNSGLVWFFMEKGNVDCLFSEPTDNNSFERSLTVATSVICDVSDENNITLNYDGIDLTYQSTDECFRYVYNGDGLWSIQPGGCNDIHQVICQRKIQGNSFNQWTQGGGLPTTTSAVTTTEATTTPTTTTEATTTPTTTTEATTTTTEATTRTTTRTGLVPGIVNPLLG